MSYLELNNINTYYDKSHVLFDVSMEIEEGQMVSLLGRNGAGKTTTLRSIMGVQSPREGTITFDGTTISDMEPYEISNLGIAMIPEDRRVFSQLTVKENLRIGSLGHDTVDNLDEMLDRVFDYFPRLEERLSQKAGSLSGGEQQMLTIGRALVSDPQMLLIDEPTEGLMPTLVDTLMDVISRMHDDGMTILLVEQNAQMALEISDYTYVLDEGEIRDHRPSQEMLEDREIQEQYLSVG